MAINEAKQNYYNVYGADIDKGQWDEQVPHFLQMKETHIYALLLAVSQNTARIEECQ